MGKKGWFSLIPYEHPYMLFLYLINIKFKYEEWGIGVLLDKCV